MSSESVRVISNITKEYPSMIKVVIYKEPKMYVKRSSVKRPHELVERDYVPEVSSLNRTKTTIKDLVLSNNFDLFCTFTFDPDKVDRYSYSACYHKFSRWIHNQQSKSPDLKYILVPEQHKDGAWHFHALISQYNGSLRDSKHKSSTGRPIFNITSFRSGFSTAVKIDSNEAVSNYVTKYITKDFIKTFNKRRFACSRNLLRPIKVVNSTTFSLTPPLFRHKTGETIDREFYTLDTF